MVDYPREYELVFSGEKKMKKSFKPEKVSFLYDYPESMTQFTELAQNLMWESEMMIFDTVIKMTWLRKRFIYAGKVPNLTSHKSGFLYNIAYASMFKNIVGFCPNMFTKCSNGWMRLIMTYIPDFFPDFDLANPFETKFEYPYKYMSLECLVLVYNMEERLELLQKGEEKKMKYGEFLDYILNYVSCHN